MRALLVVAAAALASTASTAAAGAQQAAPPVATGDYVRVRLHDGPPVQGHLRQVHEASIEVEADGGTLRLLDRDDVVGVERSVRVSRSRGFAEGALLGAVVWLAGGFVLQTMDPGGGANLAVAGAMITSPLAAIGGGLVGIPLRRSTWQPARLPPR